MGLYSDVNSVLLIYLDSGFGLTKDARILEFELTRLGKTVSHLKVGKQSKRRWGPIGHKTRSLPKPEKPHDLAIHIDIVSKYLLNQADRHTHMPNLEFFKVKFEWFYGCFDSVLAKTHETVDVLAKIKRGDFVGFRSEDHGMPGIAKDWDRFLHVAGGSRLKGTKWLLELWRRHPEWPELVVKHANRHDFGDFPQNVKEITEHMSDQELKELQNSFGIHLCPSEAEGYGQYLVEALSTGAITVTTDGAPMNEIVTDKSGILLKCRDIGPKGYSRSYRFDDEHMEHEIGRLIEMSLDEKQQRSNMARQRFEEIVADFRMRFEELFASRD